MELAHTLILEIQYGDQKTDLLCDPATTLQGIYPSKMKSVEKILGTFMFIAAQFTRAKRGNQPDIQKTGKIQCAIHCGTLLHNKTE